MVSRVTRTVLELSKHRLPAHLIRLETVNRLTILMEETHGEVLARSLSDAS